MNTYLRFAVLLALCGTELFFLLMRSHRLSYDEESLAEAAKYRIIDVTPPDEKL